MPRLDPKEKQRREVARVIERKRKAAALRRQRLAIVYQTVVAVSIRENRAVSATDVRRVTGIPVKEVRLQFEELRRAGRLWRVPMLVKCGQRTGRDAMKGEPDQAREGYLPTCEPTVDALRIGMCEGTDCDKVPVIVVCGKRLCRTCSRGDVRSGDTFRDAADETARDRERRFDCYSASQRAGGYEPPDTYDKTLADIALLRRAR